MITIRYNCNKDGYKLFYKPAPYLYIIWNWFFENTHTHTHTQRKEKEGTYNSIWHVLCNLSLLTTEQSVETGLKELEEIETKKLTILKFKKKLFIHDKLQFKLSFMSSLNVKRTLQY